MSYVSVNAANVHCMFTTTKAHMNRTSVITLSFLLTAGAASAIAADGDMKQAYPSATATSPVDGQGMTGAKPSAMRDEQKDMTRGETGRGQGSGVMMTNSGEKAAEAREAQRADKPVQPEPLGETARGQGSGVMMKDGTQGSMAK